MDIILVVSSYLIVAVVCSKRYSAAQSEQQLRPGPDLIVRGTTSSTGSATANVQKSTRAKCYWKARITQPDVPDGYQEPVFSNHEMSGREATHDGAEQHMALLDPESGASGGGGDGKEAEKKDSEKEIMHDGGFGGADQPVNFVHDGDFDGEAKSGEFDETHDDDGATRHVNRFVPGEALHSLNAARRFDGLLSVTKRRIMELDYALNTTVLDSDGAALYCEHENTHEDDAHGYVTQTDEHDNIASARSAPQATEQFNVAKDGAPKPWLVSEVLGCCPEGRTTTWRCLPVAFLAEVEVQWRAVHSEC